MKLAVNLKEMEDKMYARIPYTIHPTNTANKDKKRLAKCLRWKLRK